MMVSQFFQRRRRSWWKKAISRGGYNEQQQHGVIKTEHGEGGRNIYQVSDGRNDKR